MKKFITCILAIVVLFTVMFVEYRYIMTHITPTYDEVECTLHLEVFGQVDEYYIEN
jgi:hypothetical protein